MAVRDSDIHSINQLISDAMKKASDYERLLEGLKSIPDFENRREQKLDVAQENCYGIWGGGDYTVETILEIVTKWSKGEKTASAQELEQLNKTNIELLKENNHLKAEMKKLSSTIISGLTRIFNQKDALGVNFRDDIEAWILLKADQLKDQHSED